MTTVKGLTERLMDIPGVAQQELHPLSANSDTSYAALTIQDEKHAFDDVRGPSFLDATPKSTTIHSSPSHSSRNNKLHFREGGEKGWQYAMPEDIFINIFGYLSLKDLAHAGSINHSWNSVSQEPSLWETLDLSSIFYRVDDRLLKAQLNSHRFRSLKTLSLEGCSAITSESIRVIQEQCKNLKTLLLTDCTGIDPYLLLDLVHHIPLDRLEIYHVTQDYALAGRLRAIRPTINLGFFWLQYCAVTGLRVSEEGEQAVCRFDGAMHAERACWGRVKGRLIYSNQFYHRGGNYPAEVSFSCDAHRTMDERDDELFLCEVCECLFRRSSMWPELICCTCFDNENLYDRKHWIPLTQRSLHNFDFSDVVTKTLRLADRKNLPSTLRNVGNVACELDYRRPAIEQNPDDADGEEKKQSTLVPISVFLDSNRWRVTDQVAALTELLRRAAQERDTRALLVYDEDDNVEVLADKGLIIKGRDGEELMRLTLQAWAQANRIVYPFVLVIAIVAYFVSLFTRHSVTPYETESYTKYLYDVQPPQFPAQIILVGGAIVLVLAVLLICLCRRFRDQCECIFKVFLKLDIGILLSVGGGYFGFFLFEDFGIPCDLVTFALFTWNFGLTGLFALYFKVLPTVHRFYLLVLNAIMAVMMVLTLQPWMIYTFLTIMAGLDMVSEWRPNIHLLAPFLLGSNFELIYETPRILYQVGGLRLRAGCFIWYGLLVGLVVLNVPSFLATFLCVMAALVGVVFVLPFYGKSYRPLPVACILVLVFGIFQTAFITPLASSLNFLRTSPALS
eukprot:gb/GEZN01001642.1/.p1 GENE.gb/GEZN01001642.1/~~gb/GEZN01001642.1/.p1  ORF type:complete len:806 (-),score=132.93 gb/GEZN01001642.1/:489-2858(-)